MTSLDQAANVDAGEPVLGFELIRAADRQHAMAKVVAQQERDTLPVTSDGGATWTAALVPPLPFLARLPDVCLTRTGRGILSFGGLIFLSSDFGGTWVMGPAFPYERPCCSGYGFQTPRLACGFDLDFWILVGSDPRDDSLCHSPDGGTTWQRAASPFRFVDAAYASFLLDLPAAIAFSDDAQGVVLVQSCRADGDESFVLRTSNGGGSWGRAALPADVLPIGIDTLP